MALTLRGMNNFTGTGYTEALGSCLVCFLLVLLQLTHDFAPEFIFSCRPPEPTPSTWYCLPSGVVAQPPRHPVNLLQSVTCAARQYRDNRVRDHGNAPAHAPSCL